MRLINAEFFRHRRLCFGQCERLHIDFSAKEQLILGGNGSGKSVLMAACCPNPAEASDYLEGGRQVITCEHHGDIYTLVSDFSKKTPHGFYVNGTGESCNMNEGGTITVQRELVKYHFNFHRNTMELLMGVKTFPDMSPLERRNLIAELAQIDTHAIAEFMRFKKLNAQAASGAEFLRRKLVTEIEKRLPERELTQLQQTVDELQVRLTHWVGQRQSLNEAPDHAKNRLETILTTLDTKSRVFLSKPYKVPKHDPRLNDTLDSLAVVTDDTLSAYIETLGQTLAAKQSLLNQSVADWDKVTQSIETLRKVGELGLADIAKEASKLKSDIEALMKLRRWDFPISYPVQTMAALDACQDTLVRVSQELPVNTDRQFGRTVLEATEAQLAEYNVNLRKLEQHLNENEARIAHLNQHLHAPQVECPECHHTFTPAPKHHAEYQRLAEETPKLRELIKQRTEIRDGLLEKAEKNRQYIRIYREYLQCVKSFTILDAFWKLLDERRVLLDEPHNLVTYVHQMRELTRTDQQIVELQSQLDKRDVLLKQTETVQQGTLEEQLKRQHELSERVTGLQEQLIVLKQQQQQFKQFHQATRQGLALQAELITLYDQVDDAFMTYVEAMWQDFVKTEIEIVSNELAIKQKQLTEQQHHHRLITELEAQIEVAQTEADATKLIMEALSPKDGLIAENTMGFVNHFIGMMNAVIAQVWAYPLVIQPCGLDENNEIELDYRFPVMVEHPANVIPDVSKGSKAMKAMFTMAFVVAAMQHMGLKDCPLYLDEFGEGFDDAHRFESIRLIHSLMDQYPFTQLFMISHYQMTYSAFSDAQVLVLDPTNITLPSGCVYNDHAQFTFVV